MLAHRKLAKICAAFLLAAALLFPSALASSAEAGQPLAGEYDRTTGTNWYFPGYKVTYEVSDQNVAEVIRGKNGQPCVHFKQPGDVYVYATFYANGEPLEPEVYLFHITGNAVDDTSFQWGMFAMDVIRLTNERRTEAGLPALKPAFDLSDEAAIRAEEVSRVFSHTRPDGQPFHTVLEDGSYETAGENLQAGAATPEEVVEAWMNSPSHRENILSDAYTELGVGYIYVADSRYHHYWVQIFRKP